MTGRIIRIISNLYTVETIENGVSKVMECRARGKFRNDGLTPLVGDIVEYDDTQGYILDIHDRKNELTRPLIANVDYAIVVTSCKNPDYSSLLLDKMLTNVIMNNIKPIIVFTKYDLLTDDEKKEFDKIIEYYNSKCDFIINEAQMLSDKSDYDQAMYKLSSVPDVCKDCYDKCLAAVPPIYQKKIDKDGASKLAEAQAIWSAGQDVDAANRVAEILSSIDPQSSSYSAAKSLMDKVSARVKSLDDREWNFQMQQQKDKVALQKAQIKAMRDIGVAYGNHQQPTTYNIRTWW